MVLLSNHEDEEMVDRRRRKNKFMKIDRIGTCTCVLKWGIFNLNHLFLIY